MKAKVICKNLDWGTHVFYVVVNGKEYFLFSQDYKRTVEEFFKHGININELNNYSIAHSSAVRKTLDKIPLYLHYVEKEFGVEIYTKTNNNKSSKKLKPYKRESFRWQDYDWAM